jgi:hypothetical protein
MMARIVPRFLVLACLALACGCSSSSDDPMGPETPVPPTPNSPENAVRLLEWCWDERDNDLYREVFTDDYLYSFAPSDSQAVGATINRTEEITFGDHLFQDGVPAPPAPAGVAGLLALPAATHIVFATDPVLVVLPDSRPGKNSGWHREIATNIQITVTTPQTTYSIGTLMRFYLTRGDSAQIPADLVARGFGPDPNRWYVDAWADESTCPANKRCSTVGRLKVDYLGTPPGPKRP